MTDQAAKPEEGGGLGLSPATMAAVETVGELLIRAAAALGSLTPGELEALSKATEGKVTECIGWALEGASGASSGVRESLGTHPPKGTRVYQGKMCRIDILGTNEATGG